MAVWKDKTYKYWVYQFQYRGKGYGARGFKTRREATTGQEKRRKEVKTQPLQIVTGFKTMANEYLDFAKRKFVHDVYLRKVNVCRGFRKSLSGDMPADQVTPLHIHDYLKTLPSNSLYNEHRHELSALFNWIKKTYAAQYPYLINPCIAVESMTHVTAEKEIPTEKEILRLIAASGGDERDLILVCLQTLGRIDEVLRLRWHEDINFEKRYVVLWTRKRKDGAYEPDALPMNQDLYNVLMKRWRERKQDKWVFYNKQTDSRFMARPRMMKSLCKRAGIKFYGFHSLRHFMASYMMDEQKVSLKTVSGLLRHKNVRTTEVYLHSLDTSKVDASGKIEGIFTLNSSDPLHEAPTKEKRETDKNL